MAEIKPIEGAPHDVVHTAVRALLARRPYTAETDALVTLLNQLSDRHQVPLVDQWDRRCSCGVRIPWQDFASVPCPEMEPVLDLAEAIIEDDRSEWLDRGVTYVAHGALQGGGA